VTLGRKKNLVKKISLVQKKIVPNEKKRQISEILANFCQNHSVAYKT
jgi:hypothetical protein